LSLFLRFAAVSLLAAAVVPWWPARHERLVVLALDGAHLDTLQRLVREGELPSFAAVMGASAGGRVYGGSRRDPREFWNAAFRGDAVSFETLDRIWDVAAGAGFRAAAVGVPETRERVSAALIVAPGADEVDGFIGDSVGRFVAEDGAVAGPGWPYTPGPSPARHATLGLATGQATPWMSLVLDPPDGRTGVYRVYRTGDDAFYFSPVYRSARPASTYVASAPEGLLYVADDPSSSFGAPGSTRAFHDHVRELTAARFEVALGIAAERRRLLVYFDPLVALSGEPSGLDAAGHDGSAALQEAYRTLDDRLGALARAAGSRSLIAILGREPAGLHADADGDEPAPTGFFFVAGARVTGPPSPTEADLARVAPTLLRLIDVAPEAGEPIGEIAARFHRGETAAPAARHAGGRHEAGVPLTPESLRALGLLSQSTRAPVAGDVLAGGPAADSLR
jgi:hypothetical protein